jgi:hypothetical protein
MARGEYDFANAPIEPDSVLPRDEALIEVFCITPNGEPIFFEVSSKFAENGNDYWILIRNFGLFSRDFGGSRTPLAQRQFSPTEATSARKRINEYFSGSEKKNFFPFNMSKAHFLGTEFVDGWIVLLG